MRKKLLCILGISILLVGCGKKKEQYPEVAGEYYAEDDTEIILYADGTCHEKYGQSKMNLGRPKDVFLKMDVQKSQIVLLKR